MFFILFEFKASNQEMVRLGMCADIKFSNMFACVLHMFLGCWLRENGWVSFRSLSYSSWLVMLTSI